MINDKTRKITGSNKESGEASVNRKREFVDYETAIAMLSDAEVIHTFRTTGTLLVGTNWDKQALLKHMKQYEDTLLIAGEIGKTMKTYKMTITIPDVLVKSQSLWQKLLRKPVEYTPVTKSLFAPLKESEIDDIIDGIITPDILMKFGIKIENIIQVDSVLNYFDKKTCENKKDEYHRFLNEVTPLAEDYINPN